MGSQGLEARGESGGDGEPGQGGREARADHTGPAQAARQQALHQLQQLGESPRPDFSSALAKCGRVLGDGKLEGGVACLSSLGSAAHPLQCLVACIYEWCTHGMLGGFVF